LAAANGKRQAMRIAIIGAGIADNAATWALLGCHAVRCPEVQCARLLSDCLAPTGPLSGPTAQISDFPAKNFVTFFNNHRLLQYKRPVWHTVKGGTRHYVEKLTAAFRSVPAGKNVPKQ
jgi:predicted NAD/FAD-binding protein